MKYQKLIDFAEAEIIPCENSPGFFYQTNGQLAPKFRWYIVRYADFLDLFRTMIEDSEKIISRIQSEIEYLE